MEHHHHRQRQQPPQWNDNITGNTITWTCNNPQRKGSRLKQQKREETSKKSSMSKSPNNANNIIQLRLTETTSNLGKKY